MNKSQMNTALAVYILLLNHGGKKPLTKEEQRSIRKAMKTALFMLESIQEPIDENDLDNALANLLAYVVSNGKSTFAEYVKHLSRVVVKTRTILEMVDKTPLAEVLDYVYGKKKHPLTNLVRK